MNYPLYVGLILLLGLVGGRLTTRLKLPSVTGFIIVGLLLGPSFTNILSADTVTSMTFANELALGILSISLGAELHWPTLKKYGRSLPLLAVGDVLFSILFVGVGSYIFGLNIKAAVILGLLAITVSPSGVVSVIKEYESRGELSQNILAMVAIDNLIGIVLFGLVVASIESFALATGSGYNVVGVVALEFVAAIALGVFSGYAIVQVIKKKYSGSQFLVILLAVILLNTGLSNVFNLSAMLVNISSGVVITNLRNRSMSMAATLERIQLPITVMYMTLAGAKIDLSVAVSLGVLGIVYIVGRTAGKIFGCYISGRFSTLPSKVIRNVGMGLMPQAGITIGMSIIAEQKIVEARGFVTGIVLTGVIFFQIIGPLLVAKALKNANEIAIDKK